MNQDGAILGHDGAKGADEVVSFGHCSWGSSQPQATIGRKHVARGCAEPDSGMSGWFMCEEKEQRWHSVCVRCI